MDKRITPNNPYNLHNKPISGTEKTKSNQRVETNSKVNGQQPSFAQILQKQFEPQQVKFSNHAQQRLDKRNIKLSETQMNKLSIGVSKAAQKGAKDSLIIVDNIAFVVSVKNRTVVTAMMEEQMKENVFTNIDSAVIT